MDQMKLLPGSAGEVFVDFLGQRIRGAMVDGVTYMAAADVGRALGLEGDGAPWVGSWRAVGVRGGAACFPPSQVWSHGPGSL
jgi:hypothetical protein